MLQTLITSLFFGSAATLLAQSAAPLLPPPMAPEQIVYRYWPEQFVQWIGPELPYTMIELYAAPDRATGSGGAPLYDAVLTDRATGKRVHYTNQQSMADIDKHMGADAYVTNMQLDRPANEGSGATYLLRFVDHAGEPVSWQWIQGSDMSERGGGSSPAGLEPPMLLYRTRAAVAGEGSAVQIGKVVSVAEVWTEISHPPYFVAYHGAYSQGVDIAVFGGGGGRWTVTSAPSALAVGAEWKLKAEDGSGCSLRIQAMAGNHATILENDDHLPGRTVTLDASFTGGAWSIDKMRYLAAGEDANQGLTVAFTPAVSAGGEPSKFEVTAGRKTRIASGTVHGDSARPRIGWDFKDPEWLKGKTAWVNSPNLSLKPTAAETASK